MREILFRGKDIENKWIKGNYINFGFNVKNHMC